MPAWLCRYKFESACNAQHQQEAAAQGAPAVVDPSGEYGVLVRCQIDGLVLLVGAEVDLVDPRLVPPGEDGGVGARLTGWCCWWARRWTWWTPGWCLRVRRGGEGAKRGDAGGHAARCAKLGHRPARRRLARALGASANGAQSMAPLVPCWGVVRRPSGCAAGEHASFRVCVELFPSGGAISGKQMSVSGVQCPPLASVWRAGVLPGSTPPTQPTPPAKDQQLPPLGAYVELKTYRCAALGCGGRGLRTVGDASLQRACIQAGTGGLREQRAALSCAARAVAAGRQCAVQQHEPAGAI